ncbi:ER membrane protein complex subunit 10 [Onthophagus taurus]|uniref:ER membrane protein complex subunit 10 n=1 Tax=Onthophagus taurus TaxID=166361 RepID=UPI000C207F07|nr:ER membrane protein complex subunit 10 [Onthophagus taurus]
MWKLPLLVIILLYKYAIASQIDYDGMLNIRLQHSLDGTENPIFTERGNISVQSLRSAAYTMIQSPLSADEKFKLRELAINNKFYVLKAIVTTNDGSVEVYKSYVKACMLAESELTDLLSISLDYSGKVITVSMAVASTSACEGAQVPLDYLKQFVTSVHIRHSEPGPLPDTASYIEKLEREREAKEKGEVKDGRSFISKYWMYIVPVIIIMLISSANNPEAGNGGGGGGGR